MRKPPMSYEEIQFLIKELTGVEKPTRRLVLFFSEQTGSDYELKFEEDDISSISSNIDLKERFKSIDREDSMGKKNKIKDSTYSALSSAVTSFFQEKVRSC